ncbi:MAG: hypothetical protein GY708_25650 [Actinomycetia bacterium]|nr:hypothetical protein [Actinomycetes bacterium]
MDAGFNGVLFEAGDLTCDDLLGAGEPDTVTVTCECRNDGGANVEVTDTDEAEIECVECDAQLDKQVSCDNGATWNDVGFDDGAIDGCSAIDGQAVLVRYLASNLSGVELGSCELTDSNGNVLGGPEAIGTIDVGFNGTIFQADPATCGDTVDAGEPDTATLSCECVNPDGPNVPIERTDMATFECLSCDVQVDRQVSCDGGATFEDVGYGDGAVGGCSTIDGEPVIVRYTANNLSEDELDNCVLTDSNGAVLGAPVDIGTLAQGFDGQIFQTDPLTCSDGLEALEPGTATLSCECVEGGAAEPVTDQDTAEIECQGCDAQLDKQVSCDDGATWQDVGFGDGAINGCTSPEDGSVLVRYLANNLAEVPLTNCVLTDSNGAVLPAPVNVGPLEVGFNGEVFQTDALTCDDTLTEGEPNTATLTCECVDAAASVPLVRTDSAKFDCAECEIDVDKQISCDGGWNWVDVGFNDGVIDGCEAEFDGQPIKARYLARNPSSLTLENCFLTDSNHVLQNDPPIGDLPPGFEGVVWETVPRQCNDELDELEPDTATVVCECAGEEVVGTDQAWFDCRDCDVDVDRQVSCDGGLTWQDTGWRDGASQGCTASEGETVKVRYLARTRSIKTLENCTLTDSNTALLAAPVDVGTLDIAFEGVVLEVDATCGASLDSGGPDTVTLSCECEPTCQTTCSMCANYCLPGCPPDTSAENTDQSSLTCN